MQNFESITHRGEELNPSDFRAQHTLSGLSSFILPDYFDPLSAEETGRVYEAVVAILDGKKLVDMD